MKFVVTPRAAILALFTMVAAGGATVVALKWINAVPELPQPEISAKGGALDFPASPKVKDTMAPYKLEQSER